MGNKEDGVRYSKSDIGNAFFGFWKKEREKDI